LPGPYTSFEIDSGSASYGSGASPRITGFPNGYLYVGLSGYGGGGAATAPYLGELLLPDGVVGQSYTVEESAAPTGTTLPITFSIISGSLPPGLSLSTPTTSAWEISGTPTTPGTYSFTLQASNSVGAVTANLSITIHTSPGGNSGFVG
jgi:hypothetical protein